MVLFWTKAFKKPDEEKDKELLDMYTSLNEKNRKKVNFKTGLLVGCYFSIAVACLAVSASLLIFELLNGFYRSIGFILDLVFFGLSVYATYTSSTWIAAKPYQRMLLCLKLAVELSEKQQFDEMCEINVNSDITDIPNETEQTKDAGAQQQTEQQSTENHQQNTNANDDKNQ